MTDDARRGTAGQAAALPGPGTGTDGFRYLDPDVVLLLDRFRVDLVIDVGAHRGQYASELMRAGYRGRILSFEPQCDAHAELLRAASAEPRWSVGERCAIGDRPGTAQLHVAGNSQSSSLLPMLPAHERAAPASRYVGAETVSLRRLDSAAADGCAQHERVFLKVDVQGFERQVLEGAAGLMPRIVGVQVELDLVPMYEGSAQLEETSAYLRTLGFALYRIRPGFTDPSSARMLQVDGTYFREACEPPFP